jgi:hypothetical protein
MPLTTRNSKQHRFQAQRITKRTAQAATEGRTHCYVFGCKRPPLQALGKGVGRYCQPHQDHQRRHGHPTHGSFTLDDLGSYRRAAFEWLEANRTDRLVAQAMKAVDSRMDRAGPVVEPNGLVGLSPRQRADAVWSRLRRREITPLVILSAALGVAARMHVDPDPPSDPRYARVQVAKVLNRLAGGIVKRWQRTSGVGSQQLVAHQQSRGLFLITIGKDLERITEIVTEYHLAAILEHHAKRMLKWKRGRVRPYPFSEANKARKAIISIFDDGPPQSHRRAAPVKETVELRTEAGHSMTVVRH